MSTDDHMETITDPAEIHATDEPDEPRAPLVPDATMQFLIAKYGTIRPDERAPAVDREAARAMLNAANTIKATGGAVEIGGVRMEPCDEPSERGDFPCCSGDRAAGGVDPKALAHNLTTARALIEARAELESVRHLLQLRSDALARVSREAEALRAKVAAVEALATRLESLGVPIPRWYADDIRAALAVTTGEGE